MTQAAQKLCDNDLSAMGGGIGTVIYIDVLIFINIIITFVILITAEKLMKRRAKTYRLITASLIGSLFSLLIFIDLDSFLFTLFIKIASSLLLTLIAFGYISKTEYSKTTLAVIASSVIYSGMLILIYQLFKPPNMVIINDVVYFEFNPLVLLMSTAVIYIIITVFQKLFRERIKNTVVPLKFTIDGSDYSCIAKIDTGCNLTEPFSGAPVIIADQAVYTPDENAQKRVIPYTTVGGSSLLYAVKAEQVVIDKKVIDKDIYIAVSAITSADIQAIINSDIVR